MKIRYLEREKEMIDVLSGLRFSVLTRILCLVFEEEEFGVEELTRLLLELSSLSERERAETVIYGYCLLLPIEDLFGYAK